MLSKCVLITLACASVCRAEDVLQRIPRRALGFVVIRNLDAVGRKVEKLSKPFGNSTPNPVVLARVATGLGIGLKLDGDYTLVFLPGAAANEMLPLVILPVADYELFSRSVQADPSGEICRIKLLGEEILAAQVGDYAMLMNVEHRRLLEQVVAQPEASNPSFERLSDWFAEQDVAAALTPAGLMQLSRWRPPRSRRMIFGTGTSEQPSVLAEWLPQIATPSIRNWLRANAEIATVGISVDDDLNVRVAERVLLKSRSQFASSKIEVRSNRPPSFGLSSQPYVVAGGGAIPAGWGRLAAGYLLQMEKEQASMTGLEKVSDELWAKEGRAFRLLLEDVTACSIVMLPGKKGEPLVGNLLGIVTVDRVSDYLESLDEVVETWTEMTAASTSDIKPTIELERDTIDGQARVQLVVDVASASRDPNVPEFNWMLEAAFGPEGKFVGKFWQIDESRFLFGLATDEQMAAVVARVKAGDAEKPETSDSRQTLAMLEQGAALKLLVRPQGCVNWSLRVLNEFLGIGLSKESEVALPAMPDSPPLGMTATYENRILKFDVACPASTWSMLGAYVAKLRAPQ
ncbi:MAG: hypothetical protein AAGD11_19475 [Planctomycetota bacterium]